jgi:hypothetical protein
MAKSQMDQVGYWAFVIGVIVAVLAGLAAGSGGGLSADTNAAVGAALVVLGVIVGWFNVKEKAFMPFMLMAVTLIVGATAKFSLLDPILVGPYITGILQYIALFVSPAAVLVALKIFWKEASGQ